MGKRQVYTYVNTVTTLHSAAIPRSPPAPTKPRANFDCSQTQAVVLLVCKVGQDLLDKVAGQPFMRLIEFRRAAVLGCLRLSISMLQTGQELPDPRVPLRAAQGSPGV